MEMANKAYTAEILDDLINQLGIETKYTRDRLMNEYGIIFKKDNGRFSDMIYLLLEFDEEKTNAYRKRYPEASIYNIIGFELSTYSSRINNLTDIELLVKKNQDAMKVANLFQNIIDEKSVFIRPIDDI
jgi:hypothetical protein